MKVCKQCLEEKEYNQFSKDKTMKDGYISFCHKCQYDRNKEKKKLNNKKNYNPEYKRKYHKENIEYINYKALNHYHNNKEAYNNYVRERRKIDPNFKLRNTLRNRIRIALNNNSKFSSSIELLGCSIEEFKLYLEKQFLKGMNWENFGIVWEIDHIKGCCNFDLIQEKEQKECFHYSNQQPLFKTTKIAKQFGYNDITGNRNKKRKI